MWYCSIHVHSLCQNKAIKLWFQRHVVCLPLTSGFCAYTLYTMVIFASTGHVFSNVYAPFLALPHSSLPLVFFLCRTNCCTADNTINHYTVVDVICSAAHNAVLMQVSQVLQNLVSCRYIPFIAVQECSCEQSCGWCKWVPLQAACCVVTITYGVTLSFFILQLVHPGTRFFFTSNISRLTVGPTHLHLVLRLRMSGAVPPLPHMLPWHTQGWLCLYIAFTVSSLPLTFLVLFSTSFSCIMISCFIYRIMDPTVATINRTVRIVQNSCVLAVNYVWSITLGMWEMTYASEEQDNKAV